MKSHPVWVRGLKQEGLVGICSVYESHPVWVRGLKLKEEYDIEVHIKVAPRVGAWIETVWFIR